MQRRRPEIYDLMLTFHGGSIDSSINNVGVFTVSDDNQAEPATPFYALGPRAQGGFGALPALSELRCLALDPLDGSLLVANGFKDFNQVLQFSPASGPSRFAFASIYASDGLNHPFDLVFAFDNNLYVSNQDPNPKLSKSPVITWYSAPGAKAEVFKAQATFQTLRGLASDGSYLYVADAGTKQDGMLYAFDESGKVRVSYPLSEPVHLLYDGTRYLYIGDEHDNAVYLYDTVSRTAPSGLLTGATGLNHTGGMALIKTSPSSATLLVASRVGQAILSYAVTLGTPPTWDGAKSVLLGNLSDLPEFILASE
jgi:hypothetical protein